MARFPGVSSPAAVAGALALGLALGRARASRLRPTRTVLVTGGSRGLGLLIAREYQRRGARVAICARDDDTLGRAKALLDGFGSPVVAVPCDVSRTDDAAQLVATAHQHLGPLDTVVNNAGVVQVGPEEHMTVTDYEQAMRVHFFGALYVTEQVLPEMRRRRFGRVINIASIAGLVPVPHLLPYSASKCALAGWSRGLRTELARDGIRVTTVCPAMMRTGSPRHGRFKGRHRDEYAWFSVGDSLPGLSIAAQRAAARVVRAGEAGRGLLVMPLWARLPFALQGVWPELTSEVLTAANALLPRPGGVGACAREGRESGSAWSPSLLTALTERAARRFNQLAPDEPLPAFAAERGAAQQGHREL